MQCLDVEHCVAHVRVDFHLFRIDGCATSLCAGNTTRRHAIGGWVEQVGEVAAGPGTDKIGVVGRRADADGLGGTAEEVAQVVCNGLKHVCGVRTA